MSPVQPIVSYRVDGEQRIGEGGFLVIRRLRLRLERQDGSHSAEGVYDFVERPMGPDAVVLALYRRAPSGAIEVLLRRGLPLLRAAERQGRPHPFPEVVAGILERGDQADGHRTARRGGGA